MCLINHDSGEKVFVCVFEGIKAFWFSSAREVKGKGRSAIH
jgi:hypothetical protein